MTEKKPNGLLKFIAVTILMVIATAYIGYQIGQYAVPSSQPSQEKWLVVFPKGDVVFSIHKGNWTAIVVGSNPLLEFSSSNKTEIEQWAITQTK